MTMRFEDEPKGDMVHHPNHYNYKSMECQKIIDIMTQKVDSVQAYPLGAVIKYLYRYPKKGKAIEDLQKAKTYIDMIIKNLEEKEKENENN